MTLAETYVAVAMDQLAKLDGLLARAHCPECLYSELLDLRETLVADLVDAGADPRLLAPTGGRRSQGAVQ